MKKAAVLCAIAACVLNMSAHAQTVAGYDFSDFPASGYKGKKAPLQLGEWKMFKTILTRAHRDGTVNFGGSYILETWGCGSGCVNGAMIDKKTGKVYGMPGQGEDTPSDYCDSNDDDEDDGVIDSRFRFYPDSRLFILRGCEQDEARNQKAKQTITYEIYIWQEKRKAFEHIDTVTQTRYVTVNED